MSCQQINNEAASCFGLAIQSYWATTKFTLAYRNAVPSGTPPTFDHHFLITLEQRETAALPKLKFLKISHEKANIFYRSGVWAPDILVPPGRGISFAPRSIHIREGVTVDGDALQPTLGKGPTIKSFSPRCAFLVLDGSEDESAIELVKAVLECSRLSVQELRDVLCVLELTFAYFW